MSAFTIGTRVRMTIGNVERFVGTVVATEKDNGEDYFSVRWENVKGPAAWYQIGDRASRNIEAV